MYIKSAAKVFDLAKEVPYLSEAFFKRSCLVNKTFGMKLSRLDCSKKEEEMRKERL